MKKAILVAFVLLVFAALTAERVEINGYPYEKLSVNNGFLYRYVGDQLVEAFRNSEKTFDCVIDWLDCAYYSDEDSQKSQSGNSQFSMNYMGFRGIQRITKKTVDVLLFVTDDGILLYAVGVTDE